MKDKKIKIKKKNSKKESKKKKIRNQQIYKLFAVLYVEFSSSTLMKNLHESEPHENT